MVVRYDGGAHSRTSLFYHIVLVSKYRKKCFGGIESVVIDVFKLVERVSDFKIVEIGIDLDDHVHLLIKASPHRSVSSIVARLKQLSHKELWLRESKHLTKYFWGSKKKLWSNGYYCATVGVNDKSIIRKYIKDQANN